MPVNSAGCRWSAQAVALSGSYLAADHAEKEDLAKNLTRVEGSTHLLLCITEQQQPQPPSPPCLSFS